VRQTFGNVDIHQWKHSYTSILKELFITYSHKKFYNIGH
jgi:hypothetical protein